MRKILIILLVSLIAINAYSQSYLGFKGSFGISTLTTSQTKSRPGFDVGVILFTPLSEKWHFQPNILLSLNGVKAGDNYNPGFSAYSYSIETPLLLSYRLGDDFLSFGFDAGIFARYGLFGNYWVDTPKGRMEPDVFDYQNRIDVGPQLGISIIATRLYMGCGLQYGLVKPWDNLRGHCLNYSVSFGYLFEI